MTDTPHLPESLRNVDFQFDLSPGFATKQGHGGPSLPSSPISAALSGGGHRATLFALGALMAMRDSGMVPEQVSSVSGGSVTNLFLAHHAGDDTADDWEAATERLFRLIVDRGVLTPGWLSLIGLVYLGPIVALGVAGVTVGLPSWPWVTAMVIVWLALVLLRGLLIEEVMSRRYFGASRRAVKWGDLAGRPERLVCATDLVTGRPFYASTSLQQVFRRTDDPAELELPQTTVPWSERRRPRGVKCDAADVPVAALLRASAGFPGIPPRRIRFADRNCEAAHSNDLPTVAFLSDGGVWNNLATQPYEDRFLFDDYGPWIVFVIDASASLPRSRPLIYQVPGLAELAALIRQTVILNANTVWPRRRAYHRDVHWEMTNRFHARFRTERLYPVVALAERPLETVRRLATGLDTDDPYNTFYSDGHSEDVAAHREEYLARTRDLEQSASFARLDRAAGLEGTDVDRIAEVPTTLSRIDEDIALALVVRGYASTAATLYVTGITDLPEPSGWLAGAIGD